ncbi:MAG TPA: alpha/beta hydrolase [Jatrophihabitantaceae bacterium]|nr:alpha/beta hydrolase [Jatrophihabitantaceae bacterium]
MLSLLPRPVTRDVPTARLSDAPLPSLDEITGMWPGESVTANGVELFVRTTPPTSADAEPALFVHGLGGSATNWTDLAGLLRGRLAIEAIDLPGFGRSGPAPRNDYSLAAHARTVVAYLEQSGRGPVHLVANSMGGAIAIVVASDRPDLIRTLTLISPAVPDIRVRVHALRNDWRMALMVLPGLGDVAMRRIASVSPEARVKGTIALCFADPKRFDERRLAEAISEAKVRAGNAWSSAAFLRSMRGLVRSQFAQGKRSWAAMRRITAPTLVIWGDTDRLVAPDLAPFVAATIPDSRLLELADIGHTAMMEDPVTTARAVLGLLEDNIGA